MSQASPEQISHSRLTMISGQAFFEHLSDFSRPLPDRPWMAGDYGTIFGKLRGGGGHGRYAFPWRGEQRSAFWREYCEGTQLPQISAEAAFRLLVPFRMTPMHSPAVAMLGGAERIFFDSYIYPHGIVTALTVQLVARPPLTLDAWRDGVRALGMGRGYSVSLPGGATQSGLGARDALAAINDWFREAYFGKIENYGSSAEPVSIAAVIQGSGIDPNTPFASRSDLQKLLNAVTAWPVNWEAAQVPDPGEALLDAARTNASAGDAHYASRRGRTLWRPGLFTYRAPAGARPHMLSCLVHNQIAGIVQGESLRLFALRYGSSSPAERSGISPRLRESAAVQIDRLWRGQRTYRSSSIQRLLADKSSLAQVNTLLGDAGLAPIG